jgi:hypothetical protein
MKRMGSLQGFSYYTPNGGFELKPLNIYNGTPLGVPQDVQGQQLPINQLKYNPP